MLHIESPWPKRGFRGSVLSQSLLAKRELKATGPMTSPIEATTTPGPGCGTEVGGRWLLKNESAKHGSKELNGNQCG